jgi:hypothetical protein
MRVDPPGPQRSSPPGDSPGEALTASLSPHEKYKIVAGNVIDYFDMDPDILNGAPSRAGSSVA